MTASRADSQIYLHWWREGKREEKVISEGPVCSRTDRGRRGLERTLAMRLLPVQGISLSVLFLGLRLLSWMGPKLDQTHTVPHQPLGGIESRRQGLGPGLTPAAPPRFHKASDLFFPYITFLLEALMSQAPASHLHPELTRRGQSACRKIEWLHSASAEHWTCTLSIMTLLGSEHSVLIRSKFRSGKSPGVWKLSPIALLVPSGDGGGALTGKSLYTSRATGVCVKYWCSEGYQREAGRGQCRS